MPVIQMDTFPGKSAVRLSPVGLLNQWENGREGLCITLLIMHRRKLCFLRFLIVQIFPFILIIQTCEASGIGWSGSCIFFTQGKMAVNATNTVHKEDF